MIPKVNKVKRFFRIGLLWVYCSLSLSGYSQTEVDSLINLLDKELTDIKRFETLDTLAMILRKIDNEQALDFARAALNFSQDIDDPNMIGRAFITFGIIHTNKGEYFQAYKYYLAGDSILSETGDRIDISRGKLALGNIYNEAKWYDQAIRNYRICDSLYRELGFFDKLGGLTGNIGTIYENTGEYDTALLYFKLSLDLYVEKNQTDRLAMAYINIGSAYEQLQKYDSAKVYYMKSFELCKDVNDRDLAYTFLHLGRLNYNSGQHKQSIELLRKSLDIFQTIQFLDQYLLLNYDFLNRSYAAIEDYKTAHTYDLLFDSLNLKINTDVEELNQSIIQVEEERKFTTLRLEEERQNRIENLIYIIILGLSVIFGLLLFRDYRSKQKANRLLAEMDQLKSRLFSNISHELRTPLTLILGPLEEMMELQEDKRPSRKTVQMMQRNANRLLELVNQMLDLSRVDAGSMKLELTEEEIFRSLRIIILSFASLAEKKKINFTYHLPAKELVTWFDPDKMEKIMNNLLSNAFKFTPEDGEVKVTVSLVPWNHKGYTAGNFHMMLMTIEDNGKGIPKDQLDKIFNRFHQVEGRSDFNAAGTGIGLALTKELVDIMHGEISVESQVDKGSKFILEIPLGKEHLSDSEYTTKEATESKIAAKVVSDETRETREYEEEIYMDTDTDFDYPLVLVVEDHADIRTHIRENLKDCFRVMEAENGKFGLNKAIENIPDLIITDLIMPEMDGIELCKRLKTDERTSHIPVIMLTAKATVEDKLEGLETGADAYVTKPFSTKELRLRVSKLIEQRKNLRERFSREITLEPKEIAITSTDEKFLQKAIACIEENMENVDFNIRTFQEEMSMSRMQLFRKLKALTDYSPSEFVRNLRLKRAATLFEQGFGNVAEVTYEVGFNNLSYFAKCFKELFGVSPSDYVRDKT